MPDSETATVFKEVQLRNQLVREKLQDGIKAVSQLATAADFTRAKDNVVKTLAESLSLYGLANEVAVVGYNHGVNVATAFVGGDHSDEMSAEGKKQVELALNKAKKEDDTPSKKRKVNQMDVEGYDATYGNNRSRSRYGNSSFNYNYRPSWGGCAG